MTMSDHECYRIPEEYAGQRLDQALAQLLPDYSRARLQQWLKSGHIWVDGQHRRPKDRVLGGEEIKVERVEEVRTQVQAQDIPLDIRFEDADFLIINKPAGLVVHPAVGNPDGTLVNALLHHVPELAKLPRAGLVHRLDKDTSGLLVVARHETAYTDLVAQLQARTVVREYQALVKGVLVAGGVVEAAIGRHPVDRKRMAVTPNGRPAVTHYRVIRRFPGYTHVRVRLETGRTHQIRVHMAHIRHPVLGDPVYAGRWRPSTGMSVHCIEVLQGFRRQALHAARLGFCHPSNQQYVEWQAELPQDMQQLLAVLKMESECDKST